MSLIFKSKLIRNEIKHWFLIGVLLLWSIVATVLVVTRKDKTILIGIDDAGTRVITDSSDRLLKSELKNFLQEFLNSYYQYDDKTFLENISKATEMMSEDLWDRNKAHLIEVSENLKKVPLTQNLEIESIDLIDDGKIEVELILKIKARLNEQPVKLKVILEYKSKERSEKNPYQYELTEILEQRMS